MRVVGLTNLIVDFYLSPNKILMNGGGTVANVLANLSHMGLDTSVYGFYASDKLGKFAKDQLDKAGVDTSLLEMKEYKTKCFFIDERGTSSICPYCNGHRKNYKTRADIKNVLEEDDIILVQDVHNLGDVKNKIIWDFGYEKGILHMDESELFRLVFRKYFIVNFKKKVLDLILKKLRLTFRVFIELANIDFILITNGKKGSMVVHEGRVYSFTPEVISEVETNGCGDMYLATFVSEVLGAKKVIDFDKINEKAQKNVREVLSRVGARDYVTPNVEIGFNDKCICEDFVIKSHGL